MLINVFHKITNRGDISLRDIAHKITFFQGLACFIFSETFVVENIRCKYRQIMQYLIFELHSRIAPSIGRPTEHEHDKETVAWIRISIKKIAKEKIKGHLKPAYSCCGLSLN